MTTQEVMTFALGDLDIAEQPDDDKFPNPGRRFSGGYRLFRRTLAPSNKAHTRDARPSRIALSKEPPDSGRKTGAVSGVGEGMGVWVGGGGGGGGEVGRRVAVGGGGTVAVAVAVGCTPIHPVARVSSRSPSAMEM